MSKSDFLYFYTVLCRLSNSNRVRNGVQDFVEFKKNSDFLRYYCRYDMIEANLKSIVTASEFLFHCGDYKYA